MSHSMTTPGAPGWIQFVGPKPDAARAFYAKVMEWDIVDLPMADGSTHAAVMINEEPVGGFSNEAKTDAAWEVFITVTDVEQSHATAIELGATSLMPPTNMPGVGRMAKFRDPQGAQICIITYESMQS